MSQPMLTSHTHTMTRPTLNEATHAFRLVHDAFGALRVEAHAVGVGFDAFGAVPGDFGAPYPIKDVGAELFRTNKEVL